MELEPGTLVTPNVRLVRELGRGGMGSVWVAHHTALGTEVAVKFVSKEIIEEEPELLERFQREASMSAKIKSPYVVQTFDHGISPEGRPYIVMELLEGQNLAELLEEGPLSLGDTVSVVSQAAKALSKAHKLGIVHRDIKPDNLFISREDDELFVKVLDFGIAKQTGLPKASRVTGTGVMIGTPEYMSPEQVLSAKSVDFRSDLWALGVVAYHCLTGGVPFTGETLGSLCVAIANGSFEPPSKVRVGVSPVVDTWFLRALDKDPYERFESARQMAKSFEAAISGKLIEDIGSGSGDWSGPHQVVNMRAPLESDALSLAQSMGGAASASSHQTKVPTFAGTTVDPDVPKRRTLAAVGALALLLTVGGGVALLMTMRDASPVAEPAAEPTATQQAAAEPAAGGPTSDIDSSPPAPEPVAPAAPSVSASTSASADAETVAPDPSVQASSNVPHVPRPKVPTVVRPKTPPRPQPPGDKYGF